MDMNKIEQMKKEKPYFFLSFGFHSENEPPTVFIRDNRDAFACEVIEILEDPICLNPTGFSWNDEDWEPGPLASALLQLMNDRSDELPEIGETSGDF